MSNSYWVAHFFEKRAIWCWVACTSKKCASAQQTNQKIHRTSNSKCKNSCSEQMYKTIFELQASRKHLQLKNVQLLLGCTFLWETCNPGLSCMYLEEMCKCNSNCTTHIWVASFSKKFASQKCATLIALRVSSRNVQPHISWQRSVICKSQDTMKKKCKWTRD
jgi:hypothetical protein